jgi:hypothetical protein
MTSPIQSILRADFGEVFVFMLLAIGFSVLKMISQAAKTSKNQPAPPEPDTAAPAAPPPIPTPARPKPVARTAATARLIKVRLASASRRQAPAPAAPPPLAAARRRRRSTAAPTPDIAPPLSTPESWRAPPLTMPVIGLTGAGRVTTSIFPSLAGLAARRERRTSATGRWLRQPRRLRTAMVVREILGPPRGAAGC